MTNIPVTEHNIFCGHCGEQVYTITGLDKDEGFFTGFPPRVYCTGCGAIHDVTADGFKFSGEFTEVQHGEKDKSFDTETKQ